MNGQRPTVNGQRMIGFIRFVLGIGAAAVILAVSPRTAFDLDRFLVPKELALHATALVAGVCTLRRMRRTRADWLLIGFLGLSALSALLATNKWLGLRALAVSASSIVLFWAARAVAEAGSERQLVNILAGAVVLAAATALVQAYGLETILFASTRVPGGTLGNRNFVAHIAALGLPLCLHAALRARRFAFGAAGVVAVSAALVLTRSRAGWLAAAVALLFFTVFAFREHARRLVVLYAVMAVAAIAALLIPNALRWRSRNPYLESATGIVNYEEGSGRGRLVQNKQTLRLAAHHPLFGAGPGNWAVEYPAHATRNDPSLDDSGMTTNPWPSSDWVAFVAERGLAATLLLGVALLLMLRKRAALLGVMAGAVVAGLFDAVLLLPAPAFLAWAAFGALQPAEDAPQTGGLKAAAPLVLLVVAMGLARSAMQLTAIELFSTHSDRAALERAAQLDPGSYRIHMRLAARGGKSRCAHAVAARDLFPNSPAAQAAARGCR